MKKRSLQAVMVVIAGALALAGIFGAIGTRSVFAQADTPTPQTSPDAAPAWPYARPALRGGLLHEGYTSAALAEALGISETKLQEAVSAANAEALKQAVAQGLITQEQADQISADGRGFGWRGFGGQIDHQALLADALGISVEELQAAISQATSAGLDAAVADGSITQAQADLMKARLALSQDEKFQSSTQSAYEAALAQAVSDGVITQAQADAILAQGSGMGWGKFGGLGMGGMHGRGGMGGGMRGRGMFPGWGGGQEVTPPTSDGVNNSNG